MSRDDDFTWLKWIPAKWSGDDELQACIPSTRGCWMNWLMKMWSKDTYRLSGSFADFALWGKCDAETAESALRELHEKRAANVTFHAVLTPPKCHNDVTLLSRYRHRQWRERKLAAARQMRKRAKDHKRYVTPPSRPRNRQSRVDETRVEKSTTRRDEKSGASGESLSSASNSGASKIGPVMKALIAKVLDAAKLDERAVAEVIKLMAPMKWNADLDQAVNRMIHEIRKGKAKNDNAYVIASLKLIAAERGGV